MSQERTHIDLQELIESQPVYVKDEGDFFSLWLGGDSERIDIPMNEWLIFKAFLEINNVVYESDI